MMLNATYPALLCFVLQVTANSNKIYVRRKIDMSNLQPWTLSVAVRNSSRSQDGRVRIRLHAMDMNSKALS
jgi:hypothetical protein